MQVEPRRVYLLSPAHGGGRRCALLLAPGAAFDLAVRLRSGGAPLGAAFAFMSSLYFRGKLAYANAFAAPPAACSGALVILPGRGLVPAETLVTAAELRAAAAVPVDPADPRYVVPLQRDAAALAAALGPDGQAVLLGSVATDKYVGPLTDPLGDRLRMPREFVGRGDMSRGGLMLRCVREGVRLTYAPVAGADRGRTAARPGR